MVCLQMRENRWFFGQVQNQVADHKGIVWTHVISLRREDAARLGYDSAVQWMALLRSKRAMLCKHMKIDSANLNGTLHFIMKAIIPMFIYWCTQ